MNRSLSAHKRFPAVCLLPSAFCLVLSAYCLLFFPTVATFGQRRPSRGPSRGSHPIAVTESLAKEDRELIDEAIGVVCSERRLDSLGSVPIDDMQKRPSLSLRAPEVINGAERAQRLLPNAKALAIGALRRLALLYKIDRLSNYNLRMRRSIARIQAVVRIKPDIDARDNASVYLRNPRTITFGTIFLAGLPSDEGMVSILAHELIHIGDGNSDSLQPLFQAVGERASNLTGLIIREQRAEELTCDLIGALAVQAFIDGSPSYEPLPRRLARSVEHNCVDEDDSDEEHLSPRNTLRAVLTLDRNLRRGLVYKR
jgi:hypothetical protein